MHIMGKFSREEQSSEQGQCSWSRVNQGKRVRQEIKDVRGPGHVETSEFL